MIFWSHSSFGLKVTQVADNAILDFIHRHKVAPFVLYINDEVRYVKVLQEFSLVLLVRFYRLWSVTDHP